MYEVIERVREECSVYEGKIPQEHILTMLRGALKGFTENSRKNPNWFHVMNIECLDKGVHPLDLFYESGTAERVSDAFNAEDMVCLGYTPPSHGSDQEETLYLKEVWKHLLLMEKTRLMQLVQV